MVTDESRAVALRLMSGDQCLRIVPLRGSRGSPRVDMVKGFSRMTGKPVMHYIGDPAYLDHAGHLNAIATCCWLKGADLFLDHSVVQHLSRNTGQGNGMLLPSRTIPVTVFMGIEERSELSSIPGELMLPAIDVPRLTYEDRVAEWKKILGREADGQDAVISESARRFRYEKETIRAIGESIKGSFSHDSFINACKAGMELDLGELAQRVYPRFEGEELILPPRQQKQFDEVLQAMKSLTSVHYGWGMGKAWNEGGISVLFAGPPGSGKTMAAEVLARRLQLPMYRIDLSQVVNKYIGETEKNMKRLFDAADVSDAILFFDEADSLFGRRTEVKDAHDRYANLEVSYLLERMERFKGLAILATNRKKEIDGAFLRRLRYIVDFPFPEFEERLRIWHQVAPRCG